MTDYSLKVNAGKEAEVKVVQAPSIIPHVWSQLYLQIHQSDHEVSPVRVFIA